MEVLNFTQVISTPPTLIVGNFASFQIETYVFQINEIKNLWWLNE